MNFCLNSNDRWNKDLLRLNWKKYFLIPYHICGYASSTYHINKKERSPNKVFWEPWICNEVEFENAQFVFDSFKSNERKIESVKIQISISAHFCKNEWQSFLSFKKVFIALSNLSIHSLEWKQSFWKIVFSRNLPALIWISS